MKKITKKWIVIFLVTLNIILFSSSVATSQISSTDSTSFNNQCSIDSSLNFQVTKVLPTTGSSGNKINMGDWIDVNVQNLADPTITLKSAIEQKLITPNPQELILYLNGNALNGLTGKVVGENQLRFQLKRTEESLVTWNAILGGSFIFQPRELDVNVGCPGGITIGAPSQPIKLYLRSLMSGLFLVLFGFLLFLFLRFSRDSIRDDSQDPRFSYDLSKKNQIPYKNPSTSSIAKLLFGKKYKNKPPFSLGRTQMAWWFFIVTGSFLFIFARTGDFTNIINYQALMLIGISAGTGVGAVLIDDGKNSAISQEVDQLLTEIKSLEKQQDKSTIETIQLEKKQVRLQEILSEIPKSVGFIKDLLNNENGVSFHRYQIFVWTIILGIIFLNNVITNLTFPNFDQTLLTLQGISAGTYLGFKFPENSKPMESKDSEETISSSR